MQAEAAERARIEAEQQSARHDEEKRLEKEAEEAARKKAEEEVIAVGEIFMNNMNEDFDNEGFY